MSCTRRSLAISPWRCCSGDSFEEHLTKIGVVVEKALEESGGVSTIDAIAVTTGPGLVGSLLVGVQFAKGFALATGKPWIGINHLEGHLAAAYLGDVPVGEPHLAMVVSGGHTTLRGDGLWAVRTHWRYKG